MGDTNPSPSYPGPCRYTSIAFEEGVEGVPTLRFRKTAEEIGGIERFAGDNCIVESYDLYALISVKMSVWNAYTKSRRVASQYTLAQSLAI